MASRRGGLSAREPNTRPGRRPGLSRSLWCCWRQAPARASAILGRKRSGCTPARPGPTCSSASSIRGLEHRQVGYHIQAAWVTRLTDRFGVTAFGGPSRFRVSYQSVVDESGRYIDSQAMMRSSSRRATGGNYGFDFVFLVVLLDRRNG